VYKHVRVLSGGERTRLAVARMLLRPSNTLLLDEPTNHLDLDSKEVLLDALVDYGGTLIFVSHDRYFVERLATKIIEVGDGSAVMYPGTYKEFLWHKEQRSALAQGARAFKASDGELDGKRAERTPGNRSAKSLALPQPQSQKTAPRQSHADKKRQDAEARKRLRAAQQRQAEIDRLESEIAECEAAIREIEQAMSAPGFYDDRAAAQPIIDRHQTLMWKVGDLMHRWEELQGAADLTAGA
jgi:ATP-binding cassette subfamily F protein 3